MAMDSELGEVVLVMVVMLVGLSAVSMGDDSEASVSGMTAADVKRAVPIMARMLESLMLARDQSASFDVDLGLSLLEG